MISAAAMHRAWTELPVADIATITGPGRTMILAPHPDDESLGCGGMIAELCRLGRPPLVVIVTDGTASHPDSPSVLAPVLRRLREHEAAEALRHLGLRDPASLIFLRLRDAGAPHAGLEFEAAVARIVQHAAGCETICATWGYDPHCDHEAADLMAREVAARTGLRHLAYPVWGWTLPPETQLPDGRTNRLRRKRARGAADQSPLAV